MITRRLLLAAVAFSASAACSPVAATTVDVSIQLSTFSPSRVTVPRGQPVRFVVRNTDPIDHEWIVGDDAMHADHRLGTEPRHDARPTEITVDALTERRTTITFDQVGTLRFVCHLPGHEAYGMTGVLVVR